MSWFRLVLVTAIALAAGCTFRDVGVGKPAPDRSDAARDAAFDGVGFDGVGPDGASDLGNGGVDGGAAGTGGAGGGSGGTGGASGASGAGGAPVVDAPVETQTPMCAGAMKLCAGVCIAQAACCTDADCPALPTGQIGTCEAASRACKYACPSGQRACGDTCIATAACCKAEVECCGDGDCGLCKKCSAGRCVNQGASEDVKKECADGACRTGTCNGEGACGSTPDGQNGPMCGGECVRCRGGTCQNHSAVCSTGQMCEAGRCPPRPPVAVRIKVNGPRYKNFEPDPGPGGICGPNTYMVEPEREINGTVDDPLYRTEMWGNPLTCKVGSLPAGAYMVHLHFAEIFWGPGCAGGTMGVGSRVFDIAIEGRMVASNVDVFKEVGCAASTLGTGRPLIKSFPVTLSDGTLDLNFPAHADNAKLSAIEVISMW